MRDSDDIRDGSIIKKRRLVEDDIMGKKSMTSNIMNYIETNFDPLIEYAEEPPLENIIGDLSLYIKLVLDETPEQPPDGLTIDESAAIPLRPYFKYLKLFLTALVKLPCVPRMTVWRGVTKNLTAEFPVGTQVTWWAFLSCTTEMTVLENELYLGNSGNRTLFSVETINGRIIRNH
ncbi:unnamed protein product [Adineta steineri]|nr:unnamed protein product [Adineta steineri]